MKNFQIPTKKGVLILLVATAFFLVAVFAKSRQINNEIAGNAQGFVFPLKKIEQAAEKFLHLLVEYNAEKEPLSAPLPPAMEKMKTRGCVVDGALNGFGGDEKRMIRLMDESECYYFHRAVETWLDPPDFAHIRKNIVKLPKREEIVLGMFIAEAIDVKAKYYYPGEDRNFDFSKMCRDGSRNFWGEHTCKPSLERSEYKKYLRYITEQAMDLGVQSFMFGQVFYQDSVGNSAMPDVMREMREFADFRGLEIVIGAQTNDIEDEAYLRQFDFIEGGVGVSSSGTVESGPCFSRWDNWCWALLWHERYKSKANNVLVHLDWSGKVGDDMSVFTRMNEQTRHNTLRNLHKYFVSQDVGFLLPVQAVLHKENGGCHGPSKKYYSFDNKYSCKDQDVINAILKKQK